LLGSTLLLGIPFISLDAVAARSPQPSKNVNRSPASHAEFQNNGRRGHIPAFNLVSLRVHGGLKPALYTRISRTGRKGPMHIATAGGGYGISCVPYAREVSGIDLKGNAVAWWDEAAGLYARGNAPEPGSVLNFRANATMRLGHVAVVSSVLSRREIEIDHANWWGPGASKGGISHNISVVDVSPNNDWTAVRVGLGHTGEYGSIYSTYGFIYARREDEYARTTVAQGRSYHNAPGLAYDVAPGRAYDVAPRRAYDEVAEAPDSKRIVGLTLDAPDRTIK
jgi:hypothetical protein